MNNERSLHNIRDLEGKLQRAPTDKGAEAFLREFFTDAVADCPMNYLLAIGHVVLELRKIELKTARETN